MTASNQRNRGFTLVELMVGATLAAFAMTALLACFVFLARNFTRLSNRQALESESRLALAYLQADVALAQGVKAGTNPTATALTLKLPAGDVTYVYDAAANLLHRQANFGATADLPLLGGATSRCTAFAFDYYTGANGSPASQVSATTTIPFSVKQLAVSFVLQTRATEPAETAITYRAVSARLNLRNRGFTDGN